MNLPRCLTFVSVRGRLGRMALCAGACLSGALLLGDTLIDSGGGVSNVDKKGNGGGTLDYGQVTFSGAASYSGNTVRGFSDGGGLYAGSMVQQDAVSFSGNTAESGNGGAVYSRGNVVIAPGSSFDGNAAAKNGGALCLDANDGEEVRTVEVRGGTTFTNNKAGNLGAAIYVAGKSASCGTELVFHSTDLSRPISFSGNYRGRAPGSSSGGSPSSMTVMGNVSVVMNADRDCLINLGDPIHSFSGYSGTSRLRKTGAGTLGFGAGVSRCHFPVSVEAGTVELGSTACVRGMTELSIAPGARLSFTLPQEPPAEAKWQAQGAVTLDRTAELHVVLPAMAAGEQSRSWKLVEGSSLAMAALPAVTYDPVTAASWQQAGTFSLQRADAAGKSALVLHWARTPSPYDAWKNGHFGEDAPESQTSPDACPAGDGISNLMKYATGLDPLKPCGSVTTLTVREEAGKKHLVLAWPVNPDATDVKHEVEVSGDLENWTVIQEMETAGKTRAEFVDLEEIGEAGTERRFLRLKVSREHS